MKKTTERVTYALYGLYAPAHVHAHGERGAYAGHRLVYCCSRGNDPGGIVREYLSRYK